MNNNQDSAAAQNDTLFKDHAMEEGLSRRNAKTKLIELLGEDTVRSLLQRSDVRGWWGVISCWGTIALAMGAIVWAESLTLAYAIPVMLLAMAVIAGRQLGLAILLHEASHRSLFKSPWLNDVLANWLCGRPIFVDVIKYRKHHMVHHTKTGTKDDNDYSLVKDFPVTRSSLVRKFARDLSGISGLKAIVGLTLMNAGVIKWTVSNDIQYLPKDGKTRLDYIKQFFKSAWPTLLCNLVLLAIATACQHPELFLAWVVAYLTPYPLFLRIRSIAEHALTEQTPDMLKNTRSTKAGLLARMFVAPSYVNYHIEHHALASVPSWQLPRLHKLLREKNAVPQPPGYWDVLKLVSSASPS